MGGRSGPSTLCQNMVQSRGTPAPGPLDVTYFNANTPPATCMWAKYLKIFVLDKLFLMGVSHKHVASNDT